MNDEQVTPWCNELCQRLEADLLGDYRAVWWAIDVFRLVRNAGRFSDDDENLECLTEYPPNDATCARIASTLLKVLAAPHTDARTAAQAAQARAEAAAQHYFGIRAAQLSPEQAARLAGMVPSPRLYDRNRAAPGLAKKAAIILGRMPSAQVP